MKAILKIIADLRKAMAEQLKQQEKETDNYRWGVMNSTMYHMEHAMTVLETAANVRLRAGVITLEDRLLYDAVVVHRKPYPVEKE